MTAPSPFTYQVKASIPTQVHDDFGARYPLTYAFSLPAGSSGLAGQVWNGSGWTTLAAPPTGRFDGVECARFDYANNRAYLSVAFPTASDDLFLRVVSGTAQVGEFIGVPKFYDNRRCAVTLTYDDWLPSKHATYLQAAEAHRLANLWMSPGINAGGSAAGGEGALTAQQWADMQTAITAGYLEPTNHSKSHKNPTNYVAGEATDEIINGGTLITSNVTMPPQSRRGTSQYVQGWIRPFGSSNAECRTLLGSAKYLVDRTTQERGDAITDLLPPLATDAPEFPEAEVSCKTLITTSTVEQEAAAVAYIKGRFDTAYARRTVFFGYSYAHFWPSGWGVGSPGRDWLAYIGAYTDIWSVGVGHLYQYRLLCESVRIAGLPWLRSSAAGAMSAATCAIPPGEVGDLLVAVFAYTGSAAGGPAGWTKREDTRPSSDSNGNVAVFTRLADGTETAPTFTGASSADSQAVDILRYANVDQTTPVAASAVSMESTAASTVSSPAVAAVPHRALAVRVHNAQSMTKVASPTAEQGVATSRLWRQSNVAGRPCNSISDHAVPASTTVPDATVTIPGVSDRRNGVTVLVKPATPAAPAGSPRLVLKLGGGAVRVPGNT